MDYILSIDQGTTSSRAIVFDTDGGIASFSQKELSQHFPQTGWVEQNPEEIWESVVTVVNQVIKKVGTVAVAGITNQRETTIVWDRRDGKPIYNAIVWQDRRTTTACNKLKTSGNEKTFQYKTGLLLDPYFSGTKLAWILDNIEGARALANAGHLAFGTVDTFLIWRLTNGRHHVTDATNASRTLLFNIRTGKWDDDLLSLLDIPRSCLPIVHDNTGNFGCTISSAIDTTMTIRGVAGDQQAAAFGQACWKSGMVKSTYGTGCFVLANTGQSIIESGTRLLSTIAYQLDGVRHYALEGSIFTAGMGIDWLRDALRIIDESGEAGELSAQIHSNGGVYIVPAFTGLGAPYWRPDARGAIFGLTRDSGRAHISRAMLESIAYQTNDLIAAMDTDGCPIDKLRIDGGMVRSDPFCQILADVLDLPVHRPKVTETTALGVALIAGLGSGIYSSCDDISSHWQSDTVFHPGWSPNRRRSSLSEWKQYVNLITKTQ